MAIKFGLLYIYSKCASAGFGYLVVSYVLFFVSACSVLVHWISASGAESWAKPEEEPGNR